ncbi:MAG: hypothetical protein OXF66_09375 [Gammaproteobacteria bacterium]|nr:hypothetical protein [Gammaproteobacteria bacterium]
MGGLLEGNPMYGAEGDLGHTVWLIVHLVLFAYWLGGDLGVFYSTRMILNRSHSAPQRFMASRIMLWIDLMPRLCLSLMLTVGGILSEYVGVHHPPWQYAMIVALGPVWFTVLLVMHFKHNASFMPTLTKLDLWFRWFLIAAIVASVWWSVSTGRLDNAPWLAPKLIVFALMVLCGVMIRLYIPGFIAGVRALGQGSITEEQDDAMKRSIHRVRPWVFAIWAGLIIEAFLGIYKPGAPPAAEAVGSLMHAIQGIAAPLLG